MHLVEHYSVLTGTFHVSISAYLVNRASFRGGRWRAATPPPLDKISPPPWTNLTPLKLQQFKWHDYTASDIIYCALKLLNASPPPPQKKKNFENLFSPPLGDFLDEALVNQLIFGFKSTPY